MKSKIQSGVKLLSALFVFSFGLILLTANAQSVGAYSTTFYNNNYANPTYYMGSVNLGGQNYNQNVTPTTNVPNNVVPVVVPVNNPTSCAPYLNTFNKFGSKNSEVVKLQMFLNQYNGAKLNGKGYFGPATVQEVKNLQYAYGIKVTGAQYEKTTALINAINCGSVTVKNRVVYGKNITSNISVSKKPTVTNVYPNSGAEANPTPAVKAPAKTTSTKIDTKNGVSPMSSTPDTSSTTSGLESDLEKIKDNYKAYVLVFVLVLALFWFLRKAATE